MRLISCSPVGSLLAPYVPYSPFYRRGRHGGGQFGSGVEKAPREAQDKSGFRVLRCALEVVMETGTGLSKGGMRVGIDFATLLVTNGVFNTALRGFHSS